MREQVSIEQLEAALEEAERDYYTLESERNSKRNKLLSEAEGKINSAINAEYSERQDSLRAALRSAKDAVNAAREARALSGAGAPYPLGTKLFEWENQDRWNRKMVPTGKIGLIEAITSTSEHSGTDSVWRRADIGSYVIRILKKDGTPSKHYIKCTSWEAKNRWLPEGVDANTHEAVA